MIYDRTTKNGITIVELKDNGEIYFNGVKLNSLSIYLWDALVEHLADGKPLSYMTEENKSIGLERRRVEARAALHYRKYL